MALINRIEIANFMNRERREPWRPDWIHQILNLNGYSAAINMPNGLGKSTIAQAVLAMLTRDPSLHALRANHFAPQSNGRFTHLRVEFLLPPSDPSAADMIAQVGGGAGGDPMVVGMYGNAGENGRFSLYAYLGRLEDCPVGTREGIRYQAGSNADFLARLEKVPGRQRDDTKGSWREYISASFDIPAIEQQLAYQKNKGGEGSSGYFDVSVPGVKDYAEAVFYERLAPELLTDPMRGVEGHDDEVGIEDLIHAKVQGIVRARVRTEAAEKALGSARHLLDQFGWAQGKGAAVSDALAQFEKAQAGLAVHAAMMRTIVATDPLPGLLRTPGANAPELTSALIMQGEQWFVPDRTFEAITGEDPSAINRRADRKHVPTTQTDRSQLVEFACHLKIRDPRGNPSRLYSLESAVRLVEESPNFPGLYTRESAVQALHAAFEWAQQHADTNPARLERRRLQVELADLGEQLAKDRQAQSALNAEQTELLREQQSVGDQQRAYAKMAQAGVFSAAELAAPAQTGAAVGTERDTAQTALDAHVKAVAESKGDFAEWEKFVGEYGNDARPEDVLEEITAARDAAEHTHAQAVRDLTSARQTAERAVQEESRAQATRQRIKSTITRLEQLLPLVDAYRKRFADQPPQGLADAVRTALDQASTRIGKIENERAAMRPALEALRAFHAVQPDQDPGAWLRARHDLRAQLKQWRDRERTIDRERIPMKAALTALRTFQGERPGQDPAVWLQRRDDERADVISQHAAIQTNLDDLIAQRAEFDRGAAVAPGTDARAAMSLAGSDAVTLHAAITALGLPPDRLARVLSMFSALLFAPVLPDVTTATAVAERLAHERINIPVFSKNELEDFSRAAAIDYDGHVAHTWLVGVRTRPVDCLLDPAQVETERATLVARIEASEQSRDALAKRRAELSPSHPSEQIAQNAVEAIANDYVRRDEALGGEVAQIQRAIADGDAQLTRSQPIEPHAQHAREASERQYAARDNDLEVELTQIRQRLPDLQDRACNDSLATIQAMLEYLNVLKGTTLEGEQERLAHAEEDMLACARARESAAHDVQRLEQAEKVQQGLARAAGETLAAKRLPLSKLSKFVDVGGPAFMQAAPETGKRLRAELDKARSRIGFEFDLADSFVRAGVRRPQEIVARLAQIAPELERLVMAIPAAQERRDAIEPLLPELTSAAASIDTAARELRKQYRALFDVEMPVQSVAEAALRAHALFAPALAVRQAASTQDLVKAWRALNDALDDDADWKDVKRKHDEAAREHARSVKDFHDALDRVKGDTLLPLDDQMRLGLEQAKVNPVVLTQLHAATQFNYEQSRVATEATQRLLDAEWSKIGEWLTDFTRRLHGNLQAMVRTFRPRRDAAGVITAAGFDIETTVANLQDVRRVLDGLVDDVERREKARASIGDIEVSQYERESERRSLRRQIRSKFYRSVLLAPKVRVCMPSISQKALRLEKNIFSSGQGIAVTLLWIRKMAEYVTERELSRESVGARQRRRLRDRRTQFVIIDGAFSHLSDKKLITDALDGVKDRHGAFQLIITGHDPHYRNDYAYFPSYVAARVIGDGVSYAVNEHELIEPEAIGSHLGAVEIGSWHRHAEAS